MKTIGQNFKLLLIFLILFSCNKDDGPDGGPDVDPIVDFGEFENEALSDEDSDFLEQQESVDLDLADIILPNGKTVFEFNLEKNQNKNSAKKGAQHIKNEIISKMATAANAIANYNPSDDGVNDKNPKQSRLGYSFGQKEYTIRAIPPYGGCKSEGIAIYGLDCSGYVHHMFKGAQLGIPKGRADLQRQVSTLENAFKKLDGFEKIKAENFPNLPVQQGNFQSGDIIYWLNLNKKTSQIEAKHIGLVLKRKNGELYVYQSNGSSKTNCELNYTSIKRGPRSFLLTQAKINTFSTEPYGYGVVRIITDISGEWNLSLKCKDFVGEAANLNITIPANKGGEFQATGQGTDYDGTVFSVKLDGNYDLKTNVLSGEFTFTFGSEVRKDKFSIELLEDDTGYFALTKVIDNGGCDAEIRLKPIEENQSSSKSIAVKTSIVDFMNLK